MHTKRIINLDLTAQAASNSSKATSVFSRSSGSKTVPKQRRIPGRVRRGVSFDAEGVRRKRASRCSLCGLD